MGRRSKAARLERSRGAPRPGSPGGLRSGKGSRSPMTARSRWSTRWPISTGRCGTCCRTGRTRRGSSRRGGGGGGGGGDGARAGGGAGGGGGAVGGDHWVLTERAGGDPRIGEPRGGDRGSARA